MIAIPAKYVPIEKPDYAGELAALLLPSFRCGDLSILPVVPAVLSMWDMVNSRYCTDPQNADAEEIAVGLYIQCRRQMALEEVIAFAAGDPQPLTAAALRWFDPHAADVFAAYPEIIRYTQQGISNGFQLLPRRPRPNSEWWFDAPWLGSLAAMISEATGCTMTDAMWRVTMAEAGHIAAFAGAKHDPAGYGRKEDPAVLEQMFREAEAREDRGELHPWQIDDPERHSPTARQIEARPEILAEYEEILRKKIETNGN